MDPHARALVPKLRELLGTDEISTLDEQLTKGKEGGLTDNVLYRFIHSTKCDLPAAKERLLAWAAWRADHPLGWVPKEAVQAQLSGAMLCLQATSRRGQPLLVLNVKDYASPGDKDAFEQLLCFCMDQGVLHAQPELDPSRSLCVIFDLTGAGTSNVTLADLQALITTLQSYYVGRVGKVLIHSAPFFFSMLWRAAQAFISPSAKEIIEFTKAADVLPALEALEYEPQVIPKPYGGQAELVPLRDTLL